MQEQRDQHAVRHRSTAECRRSRTPWRERARRAYNPAAMPGRVSLEVVAGPIQGRQFAFDGHDTFLFGRSPECHAQLAPDDATASRHHFLLEVNPPAARLRDLGSLNGTYVNGQKHGGRARHLAPPEGAGQAWPEVELRDGDVIRVGATIFNVRIEGPSGTATALEARHSALDELVEDAPAAAAPDASAPSAVQVAGYAL